MPARRSPASLVVALALVACSGDERYVVVSVDVRPAVTSAVQLAVTLSNAGTMRSDALTLERHGFPVTFSVSTDGRDGELGIAVDAIDDEGQVVGRGTATTSVDAAQAAVMLEPADFVINTEAAGDQFPSDDPDAVGFQLAAAPDGTWTAAFRDACDNDACAIVGRRFDARGTPVPTAASASGSIQISTRATQPLGVPALAASSIATLAVWSANDGSTPATVACRSFDVAGAPRGAPVTVAAETADVVAIAAMAGGNFAVTWNTATGNSVLHAAIVKPDCAPVAAAPLVVSTATDFSRRGAVASSGDRVLFTWIVDGALHARVMSTAGVFITADLVLVGRTTTERVEHARPAAIGGGGFVIAARWAQSTLTAGPGRIELYRIDAAGAKVGAAIAVTDRSASDEPNREGFGLASRGDGSVMVVWHACGAIGDGSQCGVYGRMLRDTGASITPEGILATTRDGDQRRPSVAGLPDGFVTLWADASAQPPDTAGQGVRARIVYPPNAPVD